MKDIKLLFEYNMSNDTSYNKYKRYIKLVVKGTNKYWEFRNNDEVFSGNSLEILIHCLNYVISIDKFRLPINIYLNKVAFKDKLVFVVLECICFYMLNYTKRKMFIFMDPKKNILTDGIFSSPLNYLNGNHISFCRKFCYDYNRKHFREILNYENHKTSSLTDMLDRIYKFLKGLCLNNDTIDDLCESIIEIVGNSIEHAHSDCLIDIDVTDDYQKEDDTEESEYYGLNVVVVNFSDTFFHNRIKYKLENVVDLNERYVKVKETMNNHTAFFNDGYTEDDFYTVASFQHKISGSIRKSNSGGVGLTQLIKSLEEKSFGHFCYMMSQKRILYFHKEFLQYDSDNYIGFNKDNDFYEHIPDESVFANSKTFFPGTAYNLNFVIKKGEIHRDE